MTINNDITNALDSRNGAIFHTNSHKKTQVALHGEQRKFDGYICPTPDKDVLRGQYNVCIPEITSNSTIKAKLNYDLFKNRANYTGGTPFRLDVGQKVTLTRFNNSTTYCIDGTYNPSDGAIENQLEVLNAPPEEVEGNNPPKNEVTKITDPQGFINGSKYDFAHNIDYDTPYSGYLANEEKGAALWIKSNSGETGFARAYPGVKISHTWDGSEVGVYPKDKIITASNKTSVINGSDQTKPKESKSELIRFYNYQKAKLLNSNLIFFQYKDGKLIPTRLLAQIITLSNTIGYGKQVAGFIGVIDKISSYVSTAIAVMDSIVAFSEWLSLSFVDQLADVVGLLGLPSGLGFNLGGIVNVSLSLERGQPLSITAGFSTGIPLLNVFLEGVVNSLITDFLGSLDIGGILGDVLSFFGIGGKQKPEEVWTPNKITVGLPPKNVPKLKDILTDLQQALPEDLQGFIGKFTSYRVLGNQDNQIEVFESTYGISPIFIDYSKLTIDTNTQAGKLSIILIKQGAELGSYVIQNLIDFKFTNNPVYALLAVLPYLSKSSKLWVTAFVNYVLEDEDITSYLVKEFLLDGTDFSCQSIKVLANIPTELDILSIYLEEELGVTDYPDFNQIINDPYITLYNTFEDESIKPYFEELLNGKIVTFLRGVVLASSNVDIVEDVMIYKRITELVEYLF